MIKKNLVKMNIIFVNNKKYIKKILKKKINKEYLFIAFNDEIGKLLKNKGLHCKKLEEYSTKEDLNKKIIDWIKEFPNQRINNKNIKEHFTYKNISIWWLAEFFLFGTGIYFEAYQDVLFRFENIKRIIEYEKPKKVIYIDDKSLESKLIYKICNLYNIKIVTLKVKHIVNKKEVISYLKRNGIIIYKFLRYLLRKVFWHILSLFDIRKRGNNNILIFTESQWGNLYDNGKNIIDDLRFHNILKEIKKRKDMSVVVIDNPIGSKLRLEHFTKRINRFSKNPPLESYIKLSSFIGAIFDKRKIKKEYEQVKKDIQYLYEGIDFKEFFKPKFDFFFNRYIYETILYHNAIENAIDKEKPSILVVSSEANPPQRSAISLGHMKGIRSVSIQHGAVGIHSEFINNKKDICPTEFSSPPYLPLPNYLCIYGNFYKKFFLKSGGYNNKQLIITGNQKYDCVTKDIMSLNKFDLKKKFNLEKHKKIVLFFSKPYSNYEEGSRFLNEVYGALKNIKNIQIMVKIHPNEFNIGIHKKIMLEKNIKNALIFKKEDIFELGFCSDVVISYGSTVVMDMAVVKKPIVLFDPIKKDDTYCIEYAKIKAGVMTHNKQQLHEKVKNVLFDENSALKMVKDQQRFAIKEYMYRLDSNASQRIVEGLSKLIK
ncbi:hypothetical protein CEE44_02135 [Candidatus Woesearchaeota archaeon B3_Woes]|nr:MAG: hypothetical protein CEE44_02135 [Candidatus Woesearchaeota archaeon B3_Woes]